MAKAFLDGYKTYDTKDGFGNAADWKKTFKQRMNKEQAEEILNNQSENPYTILGIQKTSTKTEIKRAFRKLIIEWHPDKNPNRIDEAVKMSEKIIAAYSILS